MLMIKMHVQRSPLETIPKTVPLHEGELLRAVYGEVAAQPVGEAFDDGRKVDDVAAEYERLARIYKRDRNINMPVVQVVYGRLAEGRFQSVLAQSRAIDADPRASLPPLVAAALVPKAPTAAEAAAPTAGIPLPDIDPDNNGYVKVDELQQVLGAFGVKPPEKAKRDELFALATDTARAWLAKRQIEVGADLSLVELLDAVREADELDPAA